MPEIAQSRSAYEGQPEQARKLRTRREAGGCLLSHVYESGSPPCIAGLLHGFPVVGRESPILAGCIKVVRRGASAELHVIFLRVHPGIHTHL